MKKTIIHYEFLNLYREKLVITLLVTSCILTLVSLINGQRVLNEQRLMQSNIFNEQANAVEKAKKQFQQRQSSPQPLKWWDDIADVRGYAFYLMVDYAVKPSSSLAPIAVGQSDIYPNFFRMQVNTKQAVFQTNDTKHPLIRYLGKFDLAFFLVFILPLLLIAINFTAVTQEREREQLKIMIIQGLTPAKLLALQLLVRSSIILIPIFMLIVFWLTYVGIFIFNNTIVTTSLGIGLCLLMILAYCLFWIALTGWSISRGKSAAHNATILIASWLILVIAIPMTSNTLLKILAPIPSRITYIDTLRTVTDHIEKDTEHALSGFFQDHPELARNKQSSKLDYAVIKIARIDAIEKAMINTENNFATQLAAQQNIASTLQWFSPASLFYKTLVDLSGNGLSQHHAFLKQVEAHHRTLRLYFQQKIITASKRGDFSPCDGCKTPATFTDFDHQPRFSFTSPNNTMKSKETVFLLGLILLAIIWLNKESQRLNRLFQGGV